MNNKNNLEADSMAKPKIDYIPLAKKLKKHIEIMESTFAANNLQVINIGCKPASNIGGDLEVYVEIASVTGSNLPFSLYIKINLYDDNDDLFMTKESFIRDDRFNGYETITIYCNDSHVLDKAVKGRLFVTRF